MNNIKGQYDELRMREHFQGLLDGGMDEAQAQTAMAFSDEFSSENVNAFFESQKKKENPVGITGPAPVKSKENQNRIGISPSVLDGGYKPFASGYTAPSRLDYEKPKGDPDDVGHLLDALSKGAEKTVPVRYGHPPAREISPYAEAFTEIANSPFQTFEGSKIGSPELEVSMNPFDIINEDYKAVVDELIQSNYPKAFDQIQGLRTVVDLNNPETIRQDKLNLNYMEGMAKTMLIQDTFNNQMKAKYADATPDQMVEIEKEVYSKFGFNLDLNEDGVVGDKSSAVGDAVTSWNAGVMNFQHNARTLLFNLMGVDSDETLSEWETNYLLPGDHDVSMTRSQVEREYQKLMAQYKGEMEVAYRSNTQREFSGEAVTPFNRETINSAIESGPQSLYFLFLSMGASKNFVGATLKGKALPFAITSLGMGGMVYADTYNRTMNDEDFHYYLNPQGFRVPRKEAVDFSGNLLEGYDRVHDEGMAQGYSAMMGFNEGLSEGIGMVTLGYVGGLAAASFNNPLAQTMFERWIAGALFATGTEAVSEGFEEYVAETGQYILDKLYKENRPISELPQWLSSPELAAKRSEAFRVGFISGGAMGGGVTSTTGIKNAKDAKALLNSIPQYDEQIQEAQAQAEDETVDEAFVQENVVDLKIKKAQAKAELQQIVEGVGRQLGVAQGNRRRLNELANRANTAKGVERDVLVIKLRDELTKVTAEEVKNYEVLQSAIDLLSNNNEFSAEVATIVNQLVEDVRKSRTIGGAMGSLKSDAKEMMQTELDNINKNILDGMKRLEVYMDGRGVEYTLVLPGESVTDATTITKVDSYGNMKEVLVEQAGKEQVEESAQATEESENRFVFEDSKSVEVRGSEVMGEEQRDEVVKLMNTLEGDYSIVYHKDADALGRAVAKARMNEQGQIFEIHITSNSSIRDIQEEFVHARYDAALRENAELRKSLIGQIEKLAKNDEAIEDATRLRSIGYSDMTESQREREIITNLLIDLADGTLKTSTAEKIKKAFGVSNAQQLLDLVEETKGLLAGNKSQQAERVTEKSAELVEAVETEEEQGLDARDPKYDPDWMQGVRVRFTDTTNGRSSQYTARVNDYGHFRNLWVKMSGNGRRQLRIDVEDPNRVGDSYPDSRGVYYSLLHQMPGHQKSINQPLNYYGSGKYVKKDRETGQPVKVTPAEFTYADRAFKERQMRAQQEADRKKSRKALEREVNEMLRETGLDPSVVLYGKRGYSFYYGYRPEQLELLQAALYAEKGIMVIPNSLGRTYDIPLRVDRGFGGGRGVVKTGKVSPRGGPGGLNARDLTFESNTAQDASLDDILEFAWRNGFDGVRVITSDYSPTRSGYVDAKIRNPKGNLAKVGKEFTTMTTGFGHQDNTFVDETYPAKGGVISSHVSDGGAKFRVNKLDLARNRNMLVLVAPKMLTETSNEGDPGVYRATIGTIYKMLTEYRKADVGFKVSGSETVYTAEEIGMAIVESILNRTAKGEIMSRQSDGTVQREKTTGKKGEDIILRGFGKLDNTVRRFTIDDMSKYGFLVEEKDGKKSLRVNPTVVDPASGMPLAVVTTLEVLNDEVFYHDSNVSFVGRKAVSAAIQGLSGSKGKPSGGLGGLKNAETGQYIFDTKNGSYKAWREENFALKVGEEYVAGTSPRGYLINPHSGYQYEYDKTGLERTAQDEPGKPLPPRSAYRHTIVANEAMIINLEGMPTEADLKDETYTEDRPGMDFVHIKGQDARRLGRISHTGGDHWSPSEPTRFGMLIDAIAIKLQDKYSDIIHLQRDVEEYKNARASHSQDFNMAVDLMYGKTRNDLEFLEGYLDDLKSSMKVNNVSSQDLSDYLYARHAQERNSFIATRRDDLEAGSGMTNEEAIEILDRLDTREMRELAAMVYAIIEDTRQTYIDFGLEEQMTIDAWRSLYDFYVPLQGMSQDEADSETTSYPTGGAGMSVYGSMSRKAKGRTGKTETNLIAQVVMQNAMAHTAARKNEALKSMYNLVKNNPNNKVWQIFNEKSPMMRTDIDGKQRPMSVAEMRASNNTVPVRINGKQEFIHFKDPSHAATLNGMSIDQQNLFTRVMRAPAGFLRNVFTVYDPNFFVSNFERDIQSAVYNAMAEAEQQNGAVYGVNSAQLTKDIISNTSKALKGMFRNAAFGTEIDPELAAYIEEWKEMGGQTGWGYHETIEELTKQLENATTDETLATKIFKTPKAFFQYVEGINEAFENSVRVAAFISAKKNGATPQRAAQLAKNITVNFNRSGEWGSTLNSAYLFFNAAMQGNARLLKSVVLGKNPIMTNGQDPKWYDRVSTPQKIAAGMSILGGLQTMMNIAMSDEDEDGELWYNKIPDYEKERNMIIMAPNGKSYYKIPMPYGYNLFHNFGLAMAETSSGNRDVDAAFMFLGLSAMSSFSPISFGQAENAVDYVTKAAAPTAMKPFMEVGYNETYFGSQVYQDQLPFGTPRPDSHMAFRSPEALQDLMITINEMTGGSKYKSGSVDINPDPYWYIFEYFIGGAGTFVTQTGALAVDGYNTAVQIANQVSEAETDDEVFEAIVNPNNYADINLTKVPLIKRQYGEPSRYYDFDKYQENRVEINQLYKELKEDPKSDAGDRYAGVGALYSELREADKVMKEVRDQKSKARDIENPLERAREINRLMELERTIMVKFNKRYNELRGED